MTGPFPVGGGPRLRCLVVAEADDVADWVTGLAMAGWEVVGTVVGTDGASDAGGPAPGGAAPAVPGAGFPSVEEALARRRVHAVVVGAPSRPGARWPASALAAAVDRAVHAVVPWAAVPGTSGDAGAGEAAAGTSGDAGVAALVRRAERSGSVLLVHGEPGAPPGDGDRAVTPEVARAVGEVLHRRVVGSPDPRPSPALGSPAWQVRSLADTVR